MFAFPCNGCDAGASSQSVHNGVQMVARPNRNRARPVDALPMLSGGGH